MSYLHKPDQMSSRNNIISCAYIYYSILYIYYLTIEEEEPNVTKAATTQRQTGDFHTQDTQTHNQTDELVHKTPQAVRQAVT